MMRKAEKMPLKKGTWSPEEDQMLITYINRYGIWNWNEMPKAAGLSRSGKSCRLRWMNYLRPNIKHGNFTGEEEETIFKLHEMLGNRWSAIAAKLPGRTDNDIKNYWNTNVRKLLKKKATSTNKLQEAKACGLLHPTFREPTPEGNGGVFNVPIELNSEISKDLSMSSPANYNELTSYNLVSGFQSIDLSENLEGQSSFSVEGLHKIEDYYTEDTWHGPIIFSNSFCDDYSLLCSVNNLSGEEQSFYGQQFPLENESNYSYGLFDELNRVIDENIGLTGEFRGLWY